METVAEFGPYSLVRAIARSSSAVSFVARFTPAPDGERLIALKFLRAHLTQEPDFNEALLAECRAAVRLNHVNIAQTFDVAAWDDRVYIALEYVDGAPLAALTDRLRTARRSAPADVSAFVLAEICAALGYAHARRDDRGQPEPICHGDIRPRSILLSFGGEVKTVDFGVARSELTVGGERALRQEDRLHFAAPEIAAGGISTPASDVFGAAAIAYLLLTGRTLYDGTAGAELLSNARKCTFAAPRSIDPSIPEELEAIVLKGLAIHPAERIESASELRNEISSWLRRTSPGFGRHRLKSFLQKELGDAFVAPSEGESKPLTRKEFILTDPDSLLGTPDEASTRPKTSAAGQFVLREEAAGLDAPFTAAPTGAASQSRGQLPVPGTRPGPVVTPRNTGPKKAAEVFATRSALDSDGDEQSSTTAAGEASVTASRDARTRPNVYIPSIVTEPDIEASGHSDDTESVVSSAVATWDPASVAGAVYDDSVDPDFARETAREFRKSRRIDRSPVPFVGATLVLGALLAGGGFFAYSKYQDAMRGTAGAVARAPSIFVTSRPQGAPIFVDGVQTAFSTPAPISGLRAGQEVAVSVSLPGYDSPAAQTVRVEATQQAQILLSMQPSEHRIRIDSDPPGAAVIRHGEAVGTTPASVGPLRVDYRDGADFVVRMESYLDERLAVDWEPGARESSVRVTLRPDPNWVAPAAIPPTGP